MYIGDTAREGETGIKYEFNLQTRALTPDMLTALAYINLQLSPCPFSPVYLRFSYTGDTAREGENGSGASLYAD